MSIDRDALGRAKRVYAWLFGLPLVLVIGIAAFLWIIRTANAPETIWFPLAVGAVLVFLLAGAIPAAMAVVGMLGLPSIPFEKGQKLHWSLSSAVLAVSLILVAYRWLTA
ncbi:MAG: hypothetical protein AAF919_11195 [Pseudomonadota bacterium]